MIAFKYSERLGFKETLFIFERFPYLMILMYENIFQMQKTTTNLNTEFVQEHLSCLEEAKDKVFPCIADGRLSDKTRFTLNLISSIYIIYILSCSQGI